MQKEFWNDEINGWFGKLLNLLNSCSELLRRNLLSWYEAISHTKKNQNS